MFKCFFFLKKFHLKVFSLYNIPAHGGLSFIGKGFFYADFLYIFGVTDEVARLGDLVGGREIYTTSLEGARINMNKMFTITSFNIWIHKSSVIMFRTKRHFFFI